jgi:predicted DCC family thiol-disulfide oxidoreductase YuxK
MERQSSDRHLHSHPTMTTPDQPTIVWDGDCGFCGRWVGRGKRITGDAVAYQRYQDAIAVFPQLREEECRKAVQLVLPDGRVLAAAHAVLQALAFGGRATWLLALYRRSRLFRHLSETAYRFVAANRSWLPG